MKVLVINKFEQQVAVTLPAIPRVGDTIPLFYKPSPKVNIVCWLPEKVLPELEGSNIDAILYVE